MTVKKENKRAVVTLCPHQQEQLKHLAEKYQVSESKVLARSLELLIAQEQAHFDVGLKKCRHSCKKCTHISEDQ